MYDKGALSNISLKSGGLEPVYYGNNGNNDNNDNKVNDMEASWDNDTINKQIKKLKKQKKMKFIVSFAYYASIIVSFFLITGCVMGIFNKLFHIPIDIYTDFVLTVLYVILFIICIFWMLNPLFALLRSMHNLA